MKFLATHYTYMVFLELLLTPWHGIIEKFTTFDTDNDIYTQNNWAVHYFGGWWFDSCYSAYLNGKYYSGGKMSHDADGATPLSWTGIHWHTAGFSNGASDSLIFSEMKVRRNL